MAETPSPTPPPQGNGIIPAIVHERDDANESLALDESTLDPRYYYRWIHSRPQRLTRMFQRGGSFVTKEDGVKVLVEQPGAADEKIYNGDTVLMKFPKERIEKRRKQVADMTRAMLAATAQQFRQKAEQAQVEITTKEMK